MTASKSNEKRWQLAVHCATMMQDSQKEGIDVQRQKTLKTSIAITGSGLFTAEGATLTIYPASSGTGIRFQRSDLPGKPEIIADLDHVVSTPRCTILGNKRVTIHTVEHLLSALKGMGVDNALLELNGPEVPILDGSAEPFVEAIGKAGLEEQKETHKIHFLKTPIYWTSGDIHLVALPSLQNRVSYTLHYPESSLLRSQYFSTLITPNEFAKEIAPSRTFCLYEEIAPFIANGLIKGGGLENAVIIKNDLVINSEGIRFSDEMVRHKVLDLIGDFSLIPHSFCAHIIAIRSGHASNVAFARELSNHIKMEKTYNGG